MSGFVLKKEGALWICGRCVSWLGKERERSPSFLVSFWGSIISLLAIQEVWILFRSLWTVTFVCLSFAEWRDEYGLGFGGVLTKVSRRSGVLIRKVSGGIWLAHWWHCELIPQKGAETSMMWTFLAGSLTEKSTWSYFRFRCVSCMIFVSWPLIFCVYIVTDPLFRALKTPGSKVN